jgi:hypothetical protein
MFIPLDYVAVTITILSKYRQKHPEPGFGKVAAEVNKTQDCTIPPRPVL